MVSESNLRKMLIVGFMCLIFTPLIGHVLGETKSVSTLEKRSLASWTTFSDSESLGVYFQGVSEYVADHFGAREWLIGLNARLKLALGESPVESVLKGRDGWHFLKTYDPLLLNVTDKLSITKALELRADYIYHRFQSLNQQGVAYVFFVAPNKMSIYPEYLPRLYQFMDHWLSYRIFSESLSLADRYYVDMVDTLQKNKDMVPGSQLYFRTDSHWNDLGASIAYQALVEKALQESPTLVMHPGHHAYVNDTYTESDLINLMGITGTKRATAPTTTFPECAQRSNIKAFMPNINVIRCGRNETVAVLIGDSFMSKIYPYFAESVGSLYIVNKGISETKLQRLVDRVNPDIIFEQTVQRDLAKPLAERL